MSPHVAVVGGGIAGLTAAYRLRRLLGPEARITVLEQTSRLGGKLRTMRLAGCDYDLGAEAFLVRRAEVQQLADELDLTDEIVHPSPASARIRAGGRTAALPSGTYMGVPGSAEAVRGVLSPSGVAAVEAEVHLPPVELGGVDVPLGKLLRERLGGEVVDRLVDPLLGGVYAGGADGLGLRAVMPALATAFDEGARSVCEAVTSLLPPVPAEGAKPPVFGAFRGGYRQLIDRLVERGEAEVRLGLPVRDLTRTPAGWRLEIGAAPAPEVLSADAVVLAVPAPSARRLLVREAVDASQRYATVELASMAVVGMAFPAGTELPEASGVLIAHGETRPDGTPLTAKAFTFSSRKWPHLRGSGGEVLVRGSVGRFGEATELRADDAELLQRVRSDFAELTGIVTPPVDSAVVRWGGGLPQYGVDHAETVAAIERGVAQLPGLAVAGATLHGVGVPACVATGDAAARRVADHLLAV